ncbi:MAG: CoA ester lyase [Jatrophihabitans sp.]|nr:MAG: CoA ester lyase [Jatrophihabitans sp.]
MGSPRSHLYVPGDREDVMSKAAARGADALILDLEDAVVPASKAAAREAVAAFLRGRPGGAAEPEIWVRINPGEAAAADLEAVVLPGLAGVCLAKAETAAEVAAVAAALDDLERSRGIAAGTVAVSPLLESGAAVLRAAQIAAAPRVCRLQVGEADLRADLGVELGPDERELLWIRSQVVTVSAAAGLEPPVGPVSTDLRDLEALRVSTLALKRLGYRSRACIHPAQVAVVNDVFTPTVDEVRRAREIVARFDAAAANASGVFTDAQGRMVDLAVVRTARRTLASAAHGEVADPGHGS